MDTGHIRACDERDIPMILAVINDAAERYRGVIPAEVWHEPYMPEAELRAELAAGVAFVAYDDGEIQGVMGLQDVKDVSLIRHAYVRTKRQGEGIGATLLAHHFYEGRGFHLVSDARTPALLRRYWPVPDRQIASSVVLADRDLQPFAE